MLSHNYSKAFNSKKLWTATSSSNIFCFCSRQRDRILLFTHPGNKIGFYIKTTTSGVFSIIGIASPIWIRKTSKRQIWLFAIDQSIITSSTNIFYDSFNSIRCETLGLDWNLEHTTTLKAILEMSMVGELTYFLGLQVKQTDLGIYITKQSTQEV